MIKRIMLLIGVLIVGAISWLGFQSVTALTGKVRAEKTLSTLWSVYEALELPNYTNNQLSILIYFNSECEHCQWEVEEIATNFNRLGSTKLAFVSHEEAEQARAFLEHHKLRDFYLPAPPDKVISTFKGGVPQLLIYKQGELQKHFRGEVKIEVILKELSEK